MRPTCPLAPRKPAAFIYLRPRRQSRAWDPMDDVGAGDVSQEDMQSGSVSRQALHHASRCRRPRPHGGCMRAYFFRMAKGRWAMNSWANQDGPGERAMRAAPRTEEVLGGWLPPSPFDLLTPVKALRFVQQVTSNIDLAFVFSWPYGYIPLDCLVLAKYNSLSFHQPASLSRGQEPKGTKLESCRQSRGSSMSCALRLLERRCQGLGTVGGFLPINSAAQRAKLMIHMCAINPRG